jgi:hypothetical protein
MDVDVCLDGWKYLDYRLFIFSYGWMWTEVSKYRSTQMNIEEIGACI